MFDIRQHVRLSRDPVVGPGCEIWEEWQARIDRERAARHGPPDPARLRLIAHAAEQERILFGRVRSRWP